MFTQNQREDALPELTDSLFRDSTVRDILTVEQELWCLEQFLLTVKLRIAYLKSLDNLLLISMKIFS